MQLDDSHACACDGCSVTTMHISCLCNAPFYLPPQDMLSRGCLSDASPNRCKDSLPARQPALWSFRQEAGYFISLGMRCSLAGVPVGAPRPIAGVGASPPPGVAAGSPPPFGRQYCFQSCRIRRKLVVLVHAVAAASMLRAILVYATCIPTCLLEACFAEQLDRCNTHCFG